MTLAIGPLFWVVLTIFVLSLLANQVQKYLFGILHTVLRDGQTATFFGAWVILPGTFIHELAHLVTAIFLLIPISGFTIRPRITSGRVILGAVEPDRSVDRRMIPIRDSIVGVAPFFFGIGAILLISWFAFSTDMVSSSQILSTPEAMAVAVRAIAASENPWLWIYLLFAVGNSIFPSEPDRYQWKMAGLIIGVIIIGLVYFGIHTLVFQSLIGIFNNVAGYLMLALAMTIVIDIVVLPILWFIFVIVDSMFGPPSR